MMQQCERRLLVLLSRCGFEELQFKTTLEVGCGTGHWLREFVKWGSAPGERDRYRSACGSCVQGAAVMPARRAHSPRERGAASFLFRKLRYRSSIDCVYLDLGRGVEAARGGRDVARGEAGRI